VDELEVVIERLVSGGDGFVRFEGIPIFVPLSAPGDRLRIRLVERRADYGRGEIVEILSPGDARREPPCPHYAVCGGCDLQHVADEEQSRLKADAVCETLVRLAGLTIPENLRVISGAMWQYRLRTQVHTAVEEEQLRVGYRRRRSHEIVAIETCPVCQLELEQTVLGLGHSPTGPVPQRIDLAVGDGGVVTSAPPLGDRPAGQVTISVAGFDLAFDARCFFQAHRELLAELVGSVVGDWTGARAFDLYGGVGLFALPCSRAYDEVVLVESDTVAARYARINARRNRVTNLEVRAQAVESWVAHMPSGADRVIIDPPRAGLAKRVRQTLIDRRPHRVTYASCHPAALARDLRDLKQTYEVESLTLVDLFPQTSHMEAVVQLV